MLCEAGKLHITETKYTTDHNTKQYTTGHNTKQYTTGHNTKHIQYTVLPEMPVVAQLIKIFPNFMQLPVHYKVHENAIQHSPKAGIVKSILIQFLKILPNSHRPSEWTLSFSNKKFVQDNLHSHACHIPNQLCHCSLIPYCLTSSINHKTTHYTSFSSHFLCY